MKSVAISIEWERVVVRRVGATHAVLCDISFAIRAGQMVAVVGHNGAGKTTLARVMTGLIPIAAGTVKVFGQPLPTQRRLVQMGFQPPSAQLLGTTIAEELAIALAARPCETGEVESDARRMQAEMHALCRRFGLNMPLTTPVHHLSGGQVARLCIASAIASGAYILVMDETQAELDPAARQAMRQLFRDLAEQGRTILLITHDMEDVLAADRVLVLEAGRLVDDLPVRSFFYSERGGATPCQQHGFEEPFLVRAARSTNQRLGLRLSPVTEMEWTEGLQHVSACR
ncbi:ABC transporter-like protein [Alicyclobacillus hesperidum URH17-3-68]|uniref:energy-coupling factor ABC transporter ATP-binding protein n=1 Tax=Alicyclobacillus hesperidum TaxID=89784 RepID=UPI000281B2E1|nr:ABC transporter ATP-binding protein [Alicyclobacillus hesperidum]EJY56216.1 ABC transporter-like protein [Alicyclobacillus hesperidum URH17-3-68]